MVVVTIVKIILDMNMEGNLSLFHEEDQNC